MEFDIDALIPESREAEFAECILHYRHWPPDFSRAIVHRREWVVSLAAERARSFAQARPYADRKALAVARFRLELKRLLQQHALAQGAPLF